MNQPKSETEAAPAKLRDQLFRLRGWIVIAFAAGVLAWRWPLHPQRRDALIALPIVVFGVAMRVWARCYFTRGSDTRRIQAHRLIVCGPYRRLRNPLYVGNMAVAAGIALAFAGPLPAGVLLAALVVHYSLVIRSEEGVLRRTHGAAYEEFCRIVPRWIPRVRPPPADSAAPAPELRHALRKEGERIAGALGAWAIALVMALLRT